VKKPLFVCEWVNRPTSRRELPVVRLATNAVLAVLLISTTACSQAQTPTVVAIGSTEAQIDGVALSAAEIRGPQRANATIAYVTDGDTITVRFSAPLDGDPDQGDSDQGDPDQGDPDQGDKNGGRETIRLIGIDTPESKRPNTPIECFSLEASNALGQLLPEGTPVRIELDVEHRDRYGRLLGYIFRASDGLFVNHEMVRSGMAAAYAFPPNISYADQFSAASTAARSNSVGLWSSCASEHEPRS
jgi:endonuclease YncB( thermonuclease family)